MQQARQPSTHGRRTRRWPWAVASRPSTYSNGGHWLIAAVVVLYLAAASYGPSVATDPAAANAAAWNLVTTGSLTIPDGWAEREQVWPAETRTGAAAIDRFPGVVVWLAPAHGMARLLGASPSDADDPLTVPAWPGSLTAALTAALAMGLLLSVLSRVVESGTAVGVTAVVALGTPMFSTAANAAWPHALSVALVTLGLWGCLATKPRVVAASVALGVLTRPHVGLGQAIAVAAAGRGRRWTFLGLASLLVGGLLLVVYSWWLFGTRLPAAGYATEPLVARALAVDPRFLVDQVIGAWLHPSRGVLVLTPILFVLLPWVTSGWRASPRWVRASAVSGVIVLLVQYRLMRFTGGSGFFGYRTSLEGLVMATPLFAVTWQEAIASRRWWRLGGVAAAVACVVIHTYGAFMGAAPPVLSAGP